MHFFYLFLIMSLSSFVWAQQDYFTPQNKIDGLQYYKDLIYRGCSDLKEKQDPLTPKEMSRLSSFTKNLVNESYSSAFSDNPKVKTAFEKDLDALVKDPACLQPGNDCRVKLLGLAIYYYQTFRPDLVECKSQKKDQELCDAENRLRTSSLQGVHATSYGTSAASKYKKHMINTKNDLTMELFRLIMHKDKINLHICNTVQGGLVHQYALEMNEAGEHYSGLDPEIKSSATNQKECVEDTIPLLQEFILSNFDEGRNTVGRDQVEPLKQKILQYLKSHQDQVVTHVSITASSSKTPLYAVIGGKKVIDPDSNKKNLAVATERASFISKMMDEIKSLGSQYAKISFVSRAELAGPEFEPLDLNDRFITRMTPGYMEKVDLLFKKNEDIFKSKGLVQSSATLMDEAKFVNLYQAKFKPFHGFQITFSGYKKENMKCKDLTKVPEKESRKSSKQ